MAWGYLSLLRVVGNEDSPIILLAGIVVGLGIIPATAIASYLTFQRVEPDFDRYMDSRFARSFRNGSWPILSVHVRTECLPEGTTFITGRIVASRDRVGEYHLRVAVWFGTVTNVSLCETTGNPRHGWVRMMRTVVNAQVGDRRNNLKWQERIPFLGIFRKWSRGRTRTLTPDEASKWQNRAYVQVHDLARRIDAKGARG